MSAPTSRRRLCGGGASLMLLAAAAAGEAKATELDGELLRLCAAWRVAEAAWRHDTNNNVGKMLGTDLGFADARDRNDNLYAEAEDLLQNIAARKPRTPEGLQAKAAVVHACFQDDPPEAGSADGAALWSLVCDIAGRAA